MILNFILLLLYFPIHCPEKHIYWEELSLNKQEEILSSKAIFKDAIDCYRNHSFMITCNKNEVLLDTLSSLSFDTEIKAFYFYSFNRMVYTADGSVSEILGSYCQKIILSDIDYVLNYLENNSRLALLYAEFLGYEFYFKNEGSSDIRYDIDEFKKIINESRVNKEFVELFYTNIEKVINSID